MSLQEQTVLLVSADRGLCEAARQELGDGSRGRRVSVACTAEAAQRIVRDAAPDVVILEESALQPETGAMPGKIADMGAVISFFATFAPVVVIASGAVQREITALVAAGAADYVEPGAGFLSVAAELAERRLRAQLRLQSARAAAPSSAPPFAAPGFGEVLRHEMNNPLTGILGNAELLLAEVRRKNDGRLPNGGQQRLETIAALAVRLRETIRRLSQQCDSPSHSEQVPAGK
jgi:signal transduction histidine kinase